MLRIFFTKKMKKYRTEKTDRQILDKIVCDRCKKEIIDEFEQDEIHNIDFVGGYNSIFGDGNRVRCDICQNCLHDLIGEFCEILED